FANGAVIQVGDEQVSARQGEAAGAVQARDQRRVHGPSRSGISSDRSVAAAAAQVRDKQADSGYRDSLRIIQPGDQRGVDRGAGGAVLADGGGRQISDEDLPARD